MSSYLRPRRGKKSTAIAQLTSANPLKRGEIFFEVPDDGVGTGPGKIKMGDGTTGYEDLPYFSEGIGGTDVTIALPTSGWGAETISGETYYTQTVTVLGATANSTPIIVPVFSTDAEMEAYTNILRVETSSNAFKFIAIAAPEASLTVVAKSVLEATGSQTADLSQITSHLNTIDGQITQLNNDLEQHTITVTADGVKTNAILIAELMGKLRNISLDGKNICVVGAVLAQGISSRVAVKCETSFREYNYIPNAFHLSAIQPGTNTVRISSFQMDTTATNVKGYMITLSNSTSITDLSSIVPNNGIILELQYKLIS